MSNKDLENNLEDHYGRKKNKKIRYSADKLENLVPSVILWALESLWQDPQSRNSRASVSTIVIQDIWDDARMFIYISIIYFW